METSEKANGAALWVEIFVAFCIAKFVQVTLMPSAYLMILMTFAYILVYFTIGKFLIRRYLTKKIW